MDEIDLASERMETFNTLALRSVLAGMMEKPSSGVCKSCFEPIEARRLKANPHAQHCRDCADEVEASVRRHHLCGPR